MKSHRRTGQATPQLAALTLFDRLGVNSRPDLLLAGIVPQTRHIRLAPAVNVLPLHHPLHAETPPTGQGADAPVHGRGSAGL